MVDPAASTDKTPAPEKKQAGGAPKDDGASFTNTRQHVADRQATDEVTERFTNTRLNIALINDPKNGPRFTMTKRESGLDTSAESSGDKAERSEKPEAPAGKAGAVKATAEPARDRGDGGGSPLVDRPRPPTPTPPHPTGVPPGAEPPDKVPVDSAKTFVGPNGTYYDESWRWMDWRGTRRSWNWPAALSFGHWFAYRRLYGCAGAYALAIAGLAAAIVNNVPVLAVALLLLLVVGLTGVYGNTLYFLAFRRAVGHVTEKGEGDYDALQNQLAAAGGTSARAPAAMGALTAIGIALAIGITYHVRGGININLWPF